MIQQTQNANTRPEAVEVAESTQSAAEAGFSAGAVNARSAQQAAAESPSAADQSPLVDHDTVTALQEDLEKALNKAQENWNLYLSARAETENVRKRAERDLQNAHKYALDKFINDLLPVKDSLEMGVDAAADIVDVNKLREGSELTLKMLKNVLEKFGVEEINPAGQKFNPEFHAAMAMQPASQAEPNTVLHVAQKGYLLNGRLLRPAMVIVAQAVSPQ